VRLVWALLALAVGIALDGPTPAYGAAPNPPTGFTAAATPAGGVSFQWTAATPIPGGYNICQGSTPAAAIALCNANVAPTINGSILHPGTLTGYTAAAGTPGSCAATMTCWYVANAWGGGISAPTAAVSVLGGGLPLCTNNIATYSEQQTDTNCQRTPAAPNPGQPFTVTCASITYAVQPTCQ